MSNQWQSTAAGRHLAGRRKTNTAPEVALRRAVHALGGRFRLHRQLAKGCTPDFVLPRRHVAVFVDGCLWHQCPVHGRTTWSGPNAALWQEKMRRNRLRDDRANQIALRLGWTVVRVWECEVRVAPDVCASRVLAAAGSSTIASGSPAGGLA